MTWPTRFHIWLLFVSRIRISTPPPPPAHPKNTGSVKKKRYSHNPASEGLHSPHECLNCIFICHISHLVYILNKGYSTHAHSRPPNAGNTEKLLAELNFVSREGCYIHTFIHTMQSSILLSFIIFRGPSSCIFIAFPLSKRSLLGVPSRESNSGLPYSKPTHYTELRRTLTATHILQNKV